MTERLLPIFNEHSVMGINTCQRLLLEGLDTSLNQGFKNAGHQVGWATEFRTVEHNICGSPKWKFSLVSLPVPKILKLFLNLKKKSLDP